MTARRHVLALDQGTSGSTALVVDDAGRVCGRGHVELPQYYPRPGWVEHEPEEIWSTVEQAAAKALAAAGVAGRDVAAVGITNQRETTILWDRATGAPVHRAISRLDIPLSRMAIARAAICSSATTPLVYASITQSICSSDNSRRSRLVRMTSTASNGSLTSPIIPNNGAVGYRPSPLIMQERDDTPAVAYERTCHFGQFGVSSRFCMISGVAGRAIGRSRRAAQI